MKGKNVWRNAPNFAEESILISPEAKKAVIVLALVSNIVKKSKFPLALKLKCDLEIELFELTVSSIFY